MAASLRGLSPHSCPFLNCDLLISGRLMVVDKGFSILLSGLRSYLDSVVLGFGDGSFYASLPLSANVCHVSGRGLGQEIIFCSMPQGSKHLLLFFSLLLFLVSIQNSGPSIFIVPTLGANSFACTLPSVSPYLCFGPLAVISYPSPSITLELLVVSNKLVVGPGLFLSGSQGFGFYPLPQWLLISATHLPFGEGRISCPFFSGK